jgi:hypothetical protein
MIRINVLTFQFVKTIPEKFGNGILFVSMEYGMAAHRCCCGCGREVITPLTPTDWKLIFDGETISLHPSIGNWSFPCRSHYWIKRNAVVWSYAMSEAEIEAGRALDGRAKQQYLETKALGGAPAQVPPQTRRESLWARFVKWWSS